MQRNVLETLIGAIVLGVAITFLVFGLGSARRTEDGGYDVNARFLQVGGLEAQGCGHRARRSSGRRCFPAW